jgi:hypothetical protein
MLRDIILQERDRLSQPASAHQECLPRKPRQRLP